MDLGGNLRPTHGFDHVGWSEFDGSVPKSLGQHVRHKLKCNAECAIRVMLPPEELG